MKSWAWVVVVEADFFARPRFAGPFVGLWRAKRWARSFLARWPRGECNIYPADCTFVRGTVVEEPF